MEEHYTKIEYLYIDGDNLQTPTKNGSTSLTMSFVHNDLDSYFPLEIFRKTNVDYSDISIITTTFLATAVVNASLSIKDWPTAVFGLRCTALQDNKTEV